MGNEQKYMRAGICRGLAVGLLIACFGALWSEVSWERRYSKMNNNWADICNSVNYLWYLHVTQKNDDNNVENQD